MKKAIFILLVVTIANYSNVIAQGWAKSVYGGGGTNVFNHFTFDADNNPVIMGTSKDLGSGKPNVFAFMKLDKVTGLQKVLKKYDGRSETVCIKMFTDEQGFIYYVGSFENYIAFGTDTLKTFKPDMAGYSNIFIAKFDNDGNNVWHLKFGSKSGLTVKEVLDAHMQDGKIHMMMRFFGDSVFYNETFVEKLPSTPSSITSFCLATFNLTDGSLDKFLNVDKFYYTNPIMFSVLPDNTYQIGVASNSSTLDIYQFSYTQPSTLIASTTYKAAVSTRADVAKTLKYLNGNYYFLVHNIYSEKDGGGSVYGTDTIMQLRPSQYNLRSANLLKLDSNLKVVAYKRFNWLDKEPELVVSKNKLVVFNRFTSTMYLEADSITSINNQKAWAILGFNQDLSLADSFQVNTTNSKTAAGFSVKHAAYDNAGNLYSQVVHGQDILFYGTLVKAALKSWDHLTVIMRKGDNLNSGLQKNNEATIASVYPNPVNDNLTITQPIIEGSVQTLTGKTVLNFNTQTIDVSQLPNGIYFLNAIGKDGVYYAKFIKN